MRNEFLRLFLVQPIDIEPVPDEEHLNGRFIKSAERAGCKGVISVRARMITAIADTKYKTTDGAPMSLIGLHGKDEVLVLGPRWAIERLASGEREPETLEYSGMIRASIEIAESELAYLRQIPALIKQADMGDSDDPANKDLRKFFRTSIDEIQAYFETNQVTEFVRAHSKEVRRHLEDLRVKLEVEHKHRLWWAGWEDFSIIASGRHIQGYPVSSEDKMHFGRKREGFLILRKEIDEE